MNGLRIMAIATTGAVPSLAGIRWLPLQPRFLQGRERADNEQGQEHAVSGESRGAEKVKAKRLVSALELKKQS